MAKVLLVDDGEMVRYALGKALRKAGHEVLEAADGVKVPSIIETEGADILVTDIIMPDQEGLGTIREVRGQYPRLPIVAMSGGGRMAGTDYLAMAKSLGADAILSKPFDKSELLALVDTLTKV